MKYFEDNSYRGEKLINLHDAMSDASRVVLSNLFFHQAVDEGDTREHRMRLAMSAYHVIAVCEAIIDRVPEEERAEAMRYMHMMVKPNGNMELYELIKRLFK